MARIREWEETTHRSSFPPDLDLAQLERWEEPAGDQLQPGDFHLHDQSRSTAAINRERCVFAL